MMVLVAVLLAACSTPAPPSSGDPAGGARRLLVSVVDLGSRQPIIGASVAVGTAEPALTDAQGGVIIWAATGTRLDAAAAGHDAVSAQIPPDGDLRLALRSNVVAGRVTDEGGRPLVGVRVFVDGMDSYASSDQSGAYRLAGVPEQGTLVFKLPGHRLGLIPIDASTTQDVALPAFTARALYAPAAIFEGAGRLDQMLALIERSEVNAMVIDVKEASGRLYWATDLPAAQAIGSIMEHPLLDLETLLPQLKQRGIYTIARMVSLKDTAVGTARPDLAVRNLATGAQWRDNGGAIWLDPFRPGVAEYLAALAGDLADKGFDEVQLDYVRFYSDGDYAAAQTMLPNTQSFRLPALRRLFRVVSAALATKRAFFGADVFPISFIAPDDQGIGQRPEVVMPFVDYFCPMVYPSHYAPGTLGFDQPNNHPYGVIDKTLEIMNRQRAGLRMVIRPWIQDFGYGRFAPYSAAQVLAEMQATADNGARGWMIWNPWAHFTEAALGGPLPGEGAAPVTSTVPDGA